MMSLSNVSAGAAASGYYRAEGYYIEGSPEAEAAASWFGKAAEELVSVGRAEFGERVDDTTFSELLNGYAPSLEKTEDGGWKEPAELGRYVDGERQHRPGLDLTFSAAKSVSIMGLVAGDERVIEAHDSAVKAAMSYVEERFVATRREVNGEIETVRDGKMLAGLFRHDTSRALDPQLHTHAVIQNMVLGSDGKWTALSNEEIFKNRILIGVVYQNELGRNLEAIGYQVERSGRHGAVEIREVPKELSAGFSKRRAEIEAALDERGVEKNGENSALAALATRKGKQNGIDRTELRDAWEKEAAQLGTSKEDLGRLRDQAVLREATRLPGVTRDGGERSAMAEARSAMDFAVEHIRERHSVYSQDQLLKVALPRVKAADVRDLERAIQERVEAKTLIQVEVKGQAHLTDKETVAAERQVIEEYRRGRGQSAIQLEGRRNAKGGSDRDGEAELKDKLRRTSLTDGQKDGVMAGLTGRDRFVAVQGYAGTGKTFMLDTLRGYAERAGYQVEGAAPTNKAVSELSTVIPSVRTTARLRIDAAQGLDRGDKSRTVLVIDEASMVSTTDMRDIMAHANRAGYARVILVGDVKQLDAVSAGTPFRQLQQAGMKTALMADIQRQRGDDERNAVLHAIKGEIKAAFENIRDVREVPKDKTFPQTIADSWLALRSADRERAGVVVLTNKVREAVNAEIRDALKGERRIAREDTRVDSLHPLSFTRAEATDAASYRRGDVVVPLKDLRKEGLTGNAVYRVVDKNDYTQKLTLRSEKGGPDREVALGPGSKTAAALVSYEPVKRDFSVGDKVKFAITDKDAGVPNGARGAVERIDDRSVTVRLQGGKSVELPLNSIAARGLDHAYSATAHDFQGATVDRIIAGMSATELLSTQKSFYVNISRARDAITLITTQAAKLAERIEQQTGERPAALDAYAELKRSQAAQQAEQERQRQVDAVERIRVGEREGPSPVRDPGNVNEIIETKLREMRESKSIPTDRHEREIEQLQKVKEGPIR